MAWQLVDDITGEPIAEGAGGPVHITLGDEEFVVDLSDRQREVLRELLSPYIAAGRPADVPKVTRARALGSRPAAGTDGPTNAEIREWARNAGVAVSPVGRIPVEVRKAYLADIGEHPAPAEVREAPAPEQPAAPPPESPAPPAPVARLDPVPAPPPLRAQPVAPSVDAFERPRPEQVDVVEQLLDEGKPLTQIAETAGLAVPQVREIRDSIGAGT